MSEYWKSTPKYWCKHCSTFVKDTPFEKKQHEETGRHQGQLKRFLRGIQNDHEMAEREKLKAKAEVDRLNKAVGGPATSTPEASSLPRRTAAPKPAASATDRQKQIQQLVAMGIAVPDEYRANMALAGDWKVISQRKIEERVIDESLNKGVRKRKFEGQEEEEEAGETVVRRGWGSTIKRYPGEEDIDDLDALLSMDSLKKKEQQEIAKKEAEPDAMIGKPTAILAGPIIHSISDNNNPTKIKTDDAEDDSKANLPDIPNEPPAPVFKKRKQKIPAG